jgi:Delta 1-pyrroline-5-carboxylate dehydrogenase
MRWSPIHRRCPSSLVQDAVTSAFDSAGQRCSALRVLCLQEDIADRVVPMLKGAMAELALGNPDRLSTDVGPVISVEAQQRLLGHIERMRQQGHHVTQPALPSETRHGLFVPPTVIEIAAVADLPGEVFGPVLHVLRYPRERLDEVVRQANATGFGLIRRAQPDRRDHRAPPISAPPATSTSTAR